MYTLYTRPCTVDPVNNYAELNEVWKDVVCHLMFNMTYNFYDFQVCSPTRQQQCPNSYFVPGACYVGDPTIDEWEFMQWNETSNIHI